MLFLFCGANLDKKFEIISRPNKDKVTFCQKYAENFCTEVQNIYLIDPFELVHAIKAVVIALKGMVADSTPGYRVSR